MCWSLLLLLHLGYLPGMQLILAGSLVLLVASVLPTVSWKRKSTLGKSNLNIKERERNCLVDCAYNVYNILFILSRDQSVTRDLNMLWLWNLNYFFFFFRDGGGRSTTWNYMTTDGATYLVTKLSYIADPKLVPDDISRTQVSNKL